MRFDILIGTSTQRKTSGIMLKICCEHLMAAGEPSIYDGGNGRLAIMHARPLRNWMVSS